MCKIATRRHNIETVHAGTAKFNSEVGDTAVISPLPLQNALANLLPAPGLTAKGLCIPCSSTCSKNFSTVNNLHINMHQR